jgi:hypothetical protein
MTEQEFNKLSEEKKKIMLGISFRKLFSQDEIDNAVYIAGTLNERLGLHIPLGELILIWKEISWANSYYDLAQDWLVATSDDSIVNLFLDFLENGIKK